MDHERFTFPSDQQSDLALVVDPEIEPADVLSTKTAFDYSDFEDHVVTNQEAEGEDA